MLLGRGLYQERDFNHFRLFWKYVSLEKNKVIYRWMNINGEEQNAFCPSDSSSDKHQECFWDAALSGSTVQQWFCLFFCTDEWTWGVTEIEAKKKTIKSLGQSDTNIHFYTMQRNLFFLIFLALPYIFPVLFQYKKKRRSILQYKKSCKIIRDLLKGCVFLKNDVFLNENKGFKYCFEAIMLQMYSGLWICEYCLGSGVKGPPLFKQFKVYGTWQLASPNSTLYSEEKQTKPKRKCSNVMSKKHDKTSV